MLKKLVTNEGVNVERQVAKEDAKVERLVAVGAKVETTSSN